MDIQTLTQFFMWCSIINGSFLIVWSAFFVAASNAIYRIHSRWFPMPRETFNVVIYSFLGLFKALFLMFNLVPYLALLIAGS